MKSSASAVWEGDLKAGAGTFSLKSGALTSQPYSFKSRFENEDGKLGTNPEELIAAAHASCFAMQLSAFLAEEGHPAENIEANATVTLVPGTGITASHLTVTAKVPDITADAFMTQAERAKENCPVSKALSGLDITMDANLES